MNSVSQILSRTQELQAQIAALRNEAVEQVKPLLQQLLEENPQIESIRWRQYTPYFNDGEACVFSVHKPTFKFVGDTSEGDDGDGYHELPWEYNPTREYLQEFCAICSRKLYETCQEISNTITGLRDELETLFGDHVKVTVTRDGVDVEEYEHD